MTCRINIVNSIDSDEYNKAIRTVYTPNKGPITKKTVLPEGKGLEAADAFYVNNGKILKQAIINLSSKK